METSSDKAASPLPDLPATLSADQKARYRAVAAIARRAADRVPHSSDKALEPAHVFELHLAREDRRSKR